MNDIISEQLKDYANTMHDAIESFARNENIQDVVYAILDARKNGQTIFAFGNGGSGCLAAHLVQDLSKHTIVGDSKSEVVVAKRIKAICLNESVACMTTWANDVGYDSVFSEQINSLHAELGDVVIGITGSGNTKNVINALTAANLRGATTVALTGGGRAKKIANISIVVDSTINYCVEDTLCCVVHVICDIVRNHIQGKLLCR